MHPRLKNKHEIQLLTADKRKYATLQTVHSQIKKRGSHCPTDPSTKPTQNEKHQKINSLNTPMQPHLRSSGATRSYIINCLVLPLPFGVILLRYASAVMLGCKALRTIWRNSIVQIKQSVRIKTPWRNES